MSNIDSFNHVVEAAREWMDRAYAKLPAEYWSGRDAFSFYFDNFSQLAHTGPRKRRAHYEDVTAAVQRNLDEHDRSSVYVGVPWCIQSCPFCDLAYARNPTLSQERHYIDVVHREVENLSKRGLGKHRMNGVYFGGGTPTVLGLDVLRYYIDGVLQWLPNRKDAVVTCEASPATITRRKLEYLATVANRISFGVQSLDTQLRKAEGRLLSGEAVLEKVALALEYFQLVNCDVIYGFRNQTLESFYETIKQLIECGVPSLTLYRLELRLGTASFEAGKDDPWDLLSDRNCRLFYYLGRYMLEYAGYTENPLGWFVKRTTSKSEAVPWSRFVQQWGNAAPYFGFGQGAFSTSIQSWQRNSPHLKDWEAAVMGDRLPISEFVTLSDTDRFLVRWMRMIRSVPFIDEKFLLDNFPGEPALLQEFIDQMHEYGLLTRYDGQLLLTDAGQSLVHWIIIDSMSALTGAPTGPALPA
jgi:oxygen-independent coproporphyrinogen-3 oxidase